jgi:hypothetical protein
MIMKSKTLFLGMSLVAINLLYTSSVQADPGRGAVPLCYVWANNPTVASYIPNGLYSYNLVYRSGGNTVTRSATGTYAVTCKGVGGAGSGAANTAWGPGGHVQVTAYGGTPNYCKVVSWATGAPDFTGNVKCYTHTGVAADTQFDLLFLW